MAFPTTKVYAELKRKMKKISNRFVRKMIIRFRHFIWQHGVNYKKRHIKYYKDKIDSADFLVVDGAGLLEYSFNE